VTDHGAEYIAEILGRGGRLTEPGVWPGGFEPREGQLMGAYPIDGAIRNRTHVIIEAPTGTGKTLMYLVPAIYHAAKHGKRVVIVTGNLTLQRQLIDKDLPRLRAALPWSFTYAEMKGKNNFLCRKRADLERAEPKHDWTPPEKSQVTHLLQWERASLDGDKTRLPIEVLSRVSKRFFIKSEDCDADRCVHHHRSTKKDESARPPPAPWDIEAAAVSTTGEKIPLPETCFADVAREDALTADIIVTNYHMLCMHLRGYAKVLPKFDVAILDEAHMAADIARKCFGYEMTPATIPHNAAVLREVAKDSRAERTLDIRLPGVETIYDEGPDVDSEEYDAESEAFEPDAPIDVSGIDPTELADRLVHLSNTFFGCLEDLRDVAPIALPRAEFVPNWRDLHHALLCAARICDLHADAILEASPKDARYYNKAKDRLYQIADRISAAMMMRGDNRFVYIVAEEERDKNPRLVLQQKALLVDDRFRERLFTNDTAVVLTSATLRTNGHFKFICNDLGLDHERTMKSFLASPFDMSKQTRLIIPAPDNAQMPAPTDPAFNDTVVRILRRVIAMARGRTLALFTSWSRLHYVESRLGDVGYRVLVQGRMSRQQLLKTFQEDVSSVLLATGSFWAGIDVPGEALSCLVIDKLPFEPDDPLSIAMKAVMKRQQLNPFYDWVMPRAILTFKQGLGRLIRRTTDRGVMMVLDNRLTKKGYGRPFLRSLDLPEECIVHRSEIISEFLGYPTDAVEP
jgi:ATP-dependent DNA helicase DinG